MITNGLTIKDHNSIHDKLTCKFPFEIEMIIAYDKSPVKANELAFNTSEFCSIRDNENIRGITGPKMDPVYLIHADIENLNEIEKRCSYFDNYAMIQKAHQKIIEFFQQRNSLAFYMGGDNFVIITDEFVKQHALEFISYGKNVLGLSMNCGIGMANTARKSMMYATASLDMISSKRRSEYDYRHAFCIQDVFPDYALTKQ